MALEDAILILKGDFLIHTYCGRTGLMMIRQNNTFKDPSLLTCISFLFAPFSTGIDNGLYWLLTSWF